MEIWNLDTTIEVWGFTHNNKEFEVQLNHDRNGRIIRHIFIADGSEPTDKERKEIEDYVLTITHT